MTDEATGDSNGAKSAGDAPKESTISLDEKIFAISCLRLESEKEWVEDFIFDWEYGVWLAHLVKKNFVSELSDEGIAAIEQTFSALAVVGNLSEQELVAQMYD